MTTQELDREAEAAYQTWFAVDFADKQYLPLIGEAFAAGFKAARAQQSAKPASGEQCGLCNGTGSIANGTDEMACGRCNGSGKSQPKAIGEPLQPSDERIMHQLRANRRRTWNRAADDEFEYWMRQLESRLKERT